ncbi:MAG: TIGR04282 family arsenosugar biosynthesis glycosyltransferase [Syntrophomonas sp.]
MKTALIIMSRIPEPGYTKTRLLERLSADECAALHRACLRDICRAVRSSKLSAYLYYTGAINRERQAAGSSMEHDLWGLLPQDYAYLTMRPQKGTNLGERMLNAAYETLAVYEAVILLGSDMPNLTPEFFYNIIDLLQEHDLVIGPAEDGGYYLLAIKKICEELFRDIPWSTSDVLDRTIEVAKKSGLTYSLLPVQTDIDTWDDLCSFYSNGQINQEYMKLDAYKYAAYIIEKRSLREGD